MNGLTNMKKTYIYLIIAGASLLALNSCSKEQETDIDDKPAEAIVNPETDESLVTIQLNVPVSEEDTKTSLGSKSSSSYPVYWSDGDGDYLSLNGTAAMSSTKNSTTQYTATFKPASGLSVYNFLYRGVSGRDDQVTFPASQSFVSGGFDSASMPMYASSASRSNSVTFNHLGALLKFSLTCNDTDHLPANKGIDSVTLTAEDDSKSLSGSFTIGKTSNLLNGTLTPASGGASLTYSFGTHKSLSSTPFVFYVAIPAGTYEGGIKLTIVDNNGGSMDLYVMTEAANKTIAAGRVREFETVEYVPASEANLIMIYDDASFLKFVNAVAGGRKTVNARVTKNTSPLTLSSETVSAFNSIEGYKGIFDGQNKAIAGLTKPLFDDLQGVVKNLTLNSTISVTDASDYNLGIFAKTIVPSSEVDDEPGLQNCTANGSINFTPSTSLEKQPSIGGLVGYNKGGFISGCTNNATVAFGDNGSVTHTGDRQPAIGGVVARSKDGGIISNCTNTGTVSCAEQFGGNIYMGGVLGFAEAKAESLNGCTNSGLVEALASCSTSGALHIGGVIGLGKCTIETCSNLAAGTVTTEACTVGTYLCQGGVIGRISGTTASYTGLTNAGTVNVAATDASSNAYVGGVVGRCNEGAAITGLSNSGNINCSSTGFEDDLFIGGIVASNETSGNVLQNCNSTGGTLSYTGALTNGNLYIGGVVGYSTKEVANCTSAMTLNVGGNITPESASKFFCTGGIVGSMSQNAPITSCLNTGNVTLSQQINEVGNWEEYTRLGGIAGRTVGSITNSSNGGIITFSGKNHCASGNPMIGGIVGDVPDNSDISISGKYSSATATNYGNVVINTTAQSKKYVYAGGVVGRLRCSVTATNAGQINVTSLTCTSLYAGGIFGSATTANASVSSCSNLAAGDFNISGLTSTQNSYIGGIAGHAENASITFTGCTNYGDVVVTSGSSVGRDFTIGGIAGTAKCALSSCTNSGLVSNAAPVTGGASYWLQIGGIIGWSDTSATITGCHNTGNVINTGNSGGYITIGGISSENKALISNSDNTGNVTNSGNSGNGRPIAIGGVVGYAHAAGLTTCSNGTSSAAGGTVSNSGTSATVYDAENKVPGIAIGGVAGMNDGYTVTTCYNKGEVTNAGASPSSYIVVGGLVGLSKGGSIYVAPCYNTGAVSNTGLVGAHDLETPDNDKWVDVGGLIGLAFEANTLSGTSSVYNYNSGTVTENSESIKPYVGGVCGESDYAASDFTYCSNRSGGNLTIKNNTRRNITIGGVVGADWQSSTMTNTSNAGNIFVQDISGSNCINVGGVLGLTSTATLISGSDESHRTTNSGNIQFKTCTYSGAIRVGGILGCWDHNNSATIQYCSNSGTISTYTTSTSSADLNATGTNYSGIGGVIGTTAIYAAANNKTISNCVNTGNITVYSAGGFYLGGVAGCARDDISNCSNSGNITYGKGSTTKRAKCMIGGVVGYGWNLGASGLYFNGTLDAHEADYSKETGVAGLIGEQNGNSTFTSCKIGGTIWGGSTEGGDKGNGAGLFICPNQSTKRSSTYSSCVIKKGTVIKYDTSTQTTINSTSDLTATNLHGRIGSSSSSTTGISVENSID